MLLVNALRCAKVSSLLAVCVLSLAIPSGLRAENAPADQPGTTSGAKIFAERCATCHGENGEGQDGYTTALRGDKSIKELTSLIDKTMPDGSPEECTGEDARVVAEFMYQEFYSPLAQERNRPATVEFSRLTVRQYQNAVTDLIGAFNSNGYWPPDKRGLQGRYFNSRGWREESKVFERLDPRIAFDFGEGKPEGFPEPEVNEEEDSEKKKSKNDKRKEEEERKQFFIAWDGSFFAPETGVYEIIVDTPTTFTLWVNENEPLLTVRVKSGYDNVYREKVTLLGGRAYSLKLHMSRQLEDTVSVQLRWKRPGRTEEVIPARYLSPNWFPETFVLKTPFPPDDASVGYERGTAVSEQWDRATTYAALETADYVQSHLESLAKIKKKDSDEEQQKKLKDFCLKFAERAFRRPLGESEKTLYVDRQFEEAEHPHLAVKRSVLLTLKSPRFLYREVGMGPFDDYSMASWLSFNLWDSIPDDNLLQAASKGELSTPEQIQRQVDRMLGDLRARSKLMAFCEQWLKLDRMHEMVKDSERFPDFDEQLVSDLRSSMELFLRDVLEGDGDFRRLLLDQQMFVNERLAEYYGLPEKPETDDFTKVSVENDGRSGVLTHPLLLSGFAHDAESSPIHRGVFVARSLLGRRLKPPPEAVAPLAPDLHEDLTTRERVILQTEPAACQTCHGMINPLGFSLENFDATGRFRLMDREKPIESEGTYWQKSGEQVSFEGARELAVFLANSPETHRAFVEQLFQYTVKQPVRAFGPETLETLTSEFEQHDFNIRELYKRIAVRSALGVQELQRESTAQVRAANN